MRYCRGPFRDCDGLILDLRGRGGSGADVYAILGALETWDRPCVALIDRFSRSAVDWMNHDATLDALRQRTTSLEAEAAFVQVPERSL